MNAIRRNLERLTLSLGVDGLFPPERELAVNLGVTRANLRKYMAEFEALGVIVRKRHKGTVVASGGLEALKTAVFVGRKDLDQMAQAPKRLLRNILERQLEDELADQASGYRLEVKEYVDDPIQLRAKARPTFAGCSATSLPQISTYGLAEDLTARVQAWSEFSNIWPNLWESVTVGGRILALPAEAHLFLLFGNRKRMEECGLDAGKPPGTWEELTSVALRMTDQGAKNYGLALPEDRHLPWGFTDFIFQAGGKLIEPAGLSWVPAFHRPAGVRAVTYLKELRWKHQVLMPNAGDSCDVAKAFFQGQAGLCIMETTDMFNLVHEHGWDDEEMCVWPLPAGPDGHDLCHVSVNAAFINACASVKEKDAAWQHLADLYGRQQVMRRSRTLWGNGIITGWPSIFRDATAQQTGVGLPQAWFRTAQRCLARALQEPCSPGWSSEIHLKPVLLRILEDPNADPQRELERAAASTQPGWELH